jgi:hypothetical protein
MTDQIRSARFWFFSRDHHTAHNGVDVWVDVPVWEVTGAVNAFRRGPWPAPVE